MAEQEEQVKIDPMVELGDTGLKRYSGYITEEFLTKLIGKQKIRVFQEMSNNDPIIGAILFATEMLLRNVEWRTEAASADPLDVEIAGFVDTLRTDMSLSWSDLISEINSMFTFGYAPFEIVYKTRTGPEQKDRTKKSKHTDGMIGWRKLSIRAQSTILRWVFNDTGGIIAVEQQSPNSFNIITIPVEKLLLFRTTSTKNNPEGKSLLRNAYRPWYFKKRIEEIEGIGIERDLAGLPVAYVPPEIMSSNASTEQQALFTTIKGIVRNIRRDEQEGVVWPLVYDEKGNELYKLDLLSTGGARQFDTTKIVDRYDTRIAMTVLADFIMLGHGKSGSWALASSKTKLFSTALGGWLNTIADVFNRFAIPRILELNGIDTERAPRYVPGDIEKEDVEKWANAVNQLILSGAMLPGSETDTKARKLLDIADQEIEGE